MGGYAAHVVLVPDEIASDGEQAVAYATKQLAERGAEVHSAFAVERGPDWYRPGHDIWEVRAEIELE